MTVKELSGDVDLGTRYLSALFGGLRKRGTAETLPDLEYVRKGITIDSGHLADYNRVCGFRLTDELPATYPHILAFPLQIALMTESSFPFPLLGMVHIANRISQRRPICLDEEFTLRVRTENLRPHDKGMQFDVVSELLVSEAEEPVWTDTSTYLRRGAGSQTTSTRDQGSAERLVHPEPDAVWPVPGDTGRRYAAVSGDRNPIHLYGLTARLFGFRSAIAHGMWSKARSLAAFEGRLPNAYTVDVGFKRPVPLPTKVAFTSWRAGAEEDHRSRGERDLASAGSTESPSGWTFELWGARKPALHLRGTITPD